MDELDDPFSDAATIDRFSSPESKTDSSTTPSWISFESGRPSMRWARTTALRTPLHICRARKQPQRVDEANFSTKPLSRRHNPSDRSSDGDSVQEHEGSATPVRSSFKFASGTGGSPSANHSISEKKSSQLFDFNLRREVLTRRSYAQQPCETIPEELLISPTRRLRKRTALSNFSNTMKSHEWHVERRRSITTPNATGMEPVRFFEVPREQQRLVRDLLRNSTAGDLPLPYFVILTDASYVETSCPAGQHATRGLETSMSEHQSCSLAFTGELLTILSYNRHAQNGLIGHGTQPSGSDVRFFELPDWSQPQMFHGISVLLSDQGQTRALLNRLAMQERPVLKCLTKSLTTMEQSQDTTFLIDRDLPRPFRREAVRVMQMEARRTAAIHAGKALPFEIPKTDRVHVYNSWLILLESLLHAGHSLAVAPDPPVRGQCNALVKGTEASKVPDHEMARQLVQASLEREIYERLQ